MEEILASIRRIISEDDAPEGDAATATASEAAAGAEEAVAAPSAAAEPAPAPADDVLELTDLVEPAETHGDIAVYPRAEPAAPAPAPEAKPVAKPKPKGAAEETLVSEPSAIAAASAFGQLSAVIAMPAEGRTLEDLTADLLRPMLKAWLDQNLPRIVEARVAEEVERIARIRVR